MQWEKGKKICLIKSAIVKNRSNIGIYFFHTIKLSIKCCKGDRQMQYSLIVQKLQEYRTKSKILQSEMAEYLDISQSEYSKIELGKTKLSYEVLSKLYKKGYDIDTQVGIGGYRIDIAVRKGGKYVLGIECDGKLYSVASSARERDYHRQKYLESRGWKIKRIWSMDWWRDPQREIYNICEIVDSL